MNQKSLMACRAFLQKCGEEKKGVLLKHLSPQQQEALESLPNCSGDLTRGITPLEKQLEKIHYSWFTPFLRTLSENDARLFLASLGEQKAQSLKKALLLSNGLLPISSPARLFLHHFLLTKILDRETDILPIEYLPESPLNALLELEPVELLALIDYLGLHDLSLELKQIIDTSKLKKIHAALSSDQQAYLKKLMQEKAPLAFRRMSLNQWDGNAETLKGLLHQRGINRLAKALFGQDRSLLWHVSHRLEMEKASLLQQLCTDLEQPKALNFIITQVLDLISQTKTKVTL